jgi:hypothetical protein
MFSPGSTHRTTCGFEAVIDRVVPETAMIDGKPWQVLFRIEGRVRETTEGTWRFCNWLMNGRWGLGNSYRLDLVAD